MPKPGEISRRQFLSSLGTASAGGPFPLERTRVPFSSAETARNTQGIAPAAEPWDITLNDKEYFFAPGFAFLVFHNHYLGGMQGGLQMILNGERILDSGDFYLVPQGSSAQLWPTAQRRVVDRSAKSATVFSKLEERNIEYRLVCRTDGKHLRIALQLDRPLKPEKVAEAGLHIYIYPKTYFSKAYQSDTGSGVFPRQFTGETVLVKGTHELQVAPDDPLHAFAVRRREGTFNLADNRRHSPQPWFSIDAPLRLENEETIVELEIGPRIDPRWRRPPVIAASQVGYHPNQEKWAVLELDPRDAAREPVRLFMVTAGGKNRLVKSARSKPWGKFLHYRYELFDFSEIRRPGVYFLDYRAQKAGPFKIDSSVYDEAWRETLEYFLPIQMCHVEVVEGVRSWHGACHLDDARQAPPWTNWTDSYRQGTLDTRFAANEHMPGLNWGGWHDAGDYDLPAGSIALTTLAMALAHEEFSPPLDQTTIDRAARRVYLHVPAGRPDLVKQVEYGAESLLASYRIAGHIFGGIIETEGYAHLGDPVNITDNLIYDPRLKPGQVECERSGNPDDRWAFTNRSTGLQYQVAQTLAVASRVLGESNPRLAAECLRTASQLWSYEQQHAPVYWACSYNPSDSGFRCEEILATAELLLTTNDAQYRRHLLTLLPVIRSISGEQFGEHWPLPPGWTLVRVLAHVEDNNFRSTVIGLAHQWENIRKTRCASNPWRVPYPHEISNPAWQFNAPVKNVAAGVWGYGWNFLWDAFRHYYYHKCLPEIFDPDPLYNGLNYTLGCHPANNVTLVSGVGARSPMEAYGFNRADWFSIPGGVISGPSLIKPDFMELKNFPFLWYQAEYVIHAAGAYIFTALAADRLLNQQRSSHEGR